MNKKLLLVFAFVLMLASEVLALGVTPGRTTINFEPLTERTLGFSIVNSEGRALDLTLVVDGDLKNYITLLEDEIKLSADEGSREIAFNLSLPYSLSPGTHYAKIFILERGNSSGSGTNVGAVVGVVTEVRVFVPYPGKYLEFSVNIIGPDEHGVTTFVVPAVNRGSEDILRAFAALEIFDLNGEKLATVNTNDASIPASGRKELTGRLEEEIPAGRYNLSISAYLDNEVIKVDKVLVVGEPLLNLREIRVSDFKLGGIAKFEITAENGWNEPLTGAYTKMKVYGANGEIIAEFSSPAQDILPKERAVFLSYWDSLGIAEGTYDAVLLLGQGQKMSEKRFKLDVQSNKIDIIGVSYVISSGDALVIKSGGIILLLVAAIVVLTIVNALWFLLIRKKMLGRRGR